ncbi:hypothetical protein D3C78_712780 [compost metagenome]
MVLLGPVIGLTSISCPANQRVGLTGRPSYQHPRFAGVQILEDLVEPAIAIGAAKLYLLGLPLRMLPLPPTSLQVRLLHPRRRAELVVVIQPRGVATPLQSPIEGPQLQSRVRGRIHLGGYHDLEAAAILVG